LRVEERGRHRAGQIEEYLDILARCVEHLQCARIRRQSEERREVDPRGERIDRRRFLRARHLHEAQDRPIGPFPHELGVDRNKARILLPLAKAGQCVRIGDYYHYP